MDDAIDARLRAGMLLFWEVPDVLSAAECSELMARIDAGGPTAAPVTTSKGMVMRPDIRNNERVMFDDAALATSLFLRVKSTVPLKVLKRAPIGANERLRCYRYRPGQRFAPHFDGSFRRSDTEESELTLIVYLNDDFEGGDTAFLDFTHRVRPKRGSALLFFHRLLHEGCTVVSGTKYVVRSDVMYRGPPGR